MTTTETPTEPKSYAILLEEKRQWGRDYYARNKLAIYRKKHSLDKGGPPVEGLESYLQRQAKIKLQEQVKLQKKQVKIEQNKIKKKEYNKKRNERKKMELIKSNLHLATIEQMEELNEFTDRSESYDEI